MILALVFVTGAFVLWGRAWAEPARAAAEGAPGAASASDGGDQVALSIGAARRLARRAWDAGDVALAHTLAQALIASNPEDAEALTLLAATSARLGDLEASRKAGRQAFRAADHPDLRFDAAYIASSAAMADESYTAAQYWLRRAYQVAETEAQRDAVAGAFRQVRAASPWRVRLDFDVAPSSNINGGAQSEFLVIEDSPFVGVLSGSARALSGVRTSITGSVAYDVSRGPDHRTSVAFQGYRSFNELSDDARDIAPNAEGSDFDYGVAEVQLSHRLRAPPGPLPDAYGIALGQTWYGGEKLDRVARVTLGRGIELAPRWRLRVTGEAERRESDRGSPDRFGKELKVALTHELTGGHLLRFSVSGTDVASLEENDEYSAFGVDAGFVLGEPLMGIRVSGTLGYVERDYPSYRIGFIQVVDGREDTVWDAALNFAFEEMGLYGFVPVLSLTQEQSTSNISRFEGETSGLSIGFRSAF